ncbi:MAG: polysulfide reductase NrfD [Syntrophales bacterium]|nr:polysulfide reductase NrfD [Syntrophales bacterium]MDD4340196.1 polysulfide reductase NrfD [Syntrophales bacterium]HOS78423.1 polysulfide reductase NrfD [Syntrophales bacterium]
MKNSPLLDSLKAAGGRIVSGGPIYLSGVSLFALLFIAGSVTGIYSVYFEGSRHAYGTSREIPLAMLISTYTFFVVASTGLCLVSSIGHIFGVRAFQPIAKRAVLLSVITILSGFLVIGLELENPFRLAIYLFTSPNFSSNIWWMGTLYACEVVLLIIEFIFLMLDRHRVSAVVGFFGILFGVAAISNLGGVFAMLNGREFWYGPYLPIFFIASAVMMGCGAIIFFTVLAHRIRGAALEGQVARSLAAVGKLLMLMLAVVLFFTIWRMVSLTAGGTEKLMVLDALVRGPYAFNFWALEIGLGIALPLLLLLGSRGRRIGIMFLSVTLMILGAFFARLQMVVVGQIVPLYWDLGVSEYSRLHTYAPTWQEALVVLAGVGFCGAAFLLGEKIFANFDEAEASAEVKIGKVDGDEP